MCGIALIACGICVDCSSVSSQQISPTTNAESCAFIIDDLEDALRRRGPDSLGSREVLLESRNSFSEHDQGLSSVVRLYGERNREKSDFGVRLEESVNGENGVNTHGNKAAMHFMGAVLQLRGVHPVQQPLTGLSNNVLVYNGELFGGIYMSNDNNDTEILMDSLEQCCCCSSHDAATTCSRKRIPELLSIIRGPWALIYWQDSARTLWFGRDAFGRRSLLVHWPSLEDPRLVLSSVSPPSPSDHEGTSELSNLRYWDELPCGLYSLTIVASGLDGCLNGKVRKHEWTSFLLNKVIRWERKFVEPKQDDLRSSDCLISAGEDSMLMASSKGNIQPSAYTPSHMLLASLRKSVARRTVESSIFQPKCDHKQGESIPVGVLFSGGVDSMILAAILHECLDSRYAIDLLNVSFEGHSAPDRITGRAGLEELKKIAPLRRWRLVEIDADLSNLSTETKHVMSLINPAKTYMDVNIGLALWLAAGGDGVVYESTDSGLQCSRYKSEARILLVGSGADEQCAGYGRHRTKFRSSSWVGLNEEMKLDVQRIWKRNLGRDDRCIADNGKEVELQKVGISQGLSSASLEPGVSWATASFSFEIRARFPFLDEDVIQLLLGFPLWEIANLEQPSGTGDKKILREVAKLLGLHGAAALPKRAIQFGSRIAQESNKKNFGSNRAANQASAGSAVVHK